jgi:hypothetical protein
MSLLDDMDLAPARSDLPPTQVTELPRPPRPSRVGPILSLALFAGVLAGFWVYRVRQTAPAETPVSGPVAPPKARSAPLAQGAPAVALPPLDQFDPFARDMVSGLTKSSVALSWLSTNHLAEQFVAIVQGTSEGEAPTRLLAPLRPRGSFRVANQAGRTVIDPASYARYDGFADAVTSLDPATSARIYGTLKPRLEEAYSALDSRYRDRGRAGPADLDARAERSDRGAGKRRRLRVRQSGSRAAVARAEAVDSNGARKRQAHPGAPA